MQPTVARLLLVALWLATPRIAIAADPPAFELWTIGRGDDLYARFGHTAIRVSDPDGGDRVYNYGTTDFSRPDLVTAFMTGEAEFWLGVSSGGRSEKVYRRVDRSVDAVELQLPPIAARWLADQLAAEAADRAVSAYRYHHFHDNCATRARDRLDEATGGALRVAMADWPDAPTYRDLARDGFADMPWLLLGLDILLGRPADRPPAPWESCFLPDYLRQAVVSAVVSWPSGEVRPLAGSDRQLYTRQGDPVGAGNADLPRRWIWLAALVILIAAGLTWRLDLARFRLAGTPLLAAGLLQGSAGTAVLIVAWMSVQHEARYNESLLWAWPLDLWFAVPGVAKLMGRTWLIRVTNTYLAVRFGSILLVLIGHALGLLVQPQLHLVALWIALLALVWAAARPCERSTLRS